MPITSWVARTAVLAVTAGTIAVMGAAPAQAAPPTMVTSTSVTDDYAYAEIYALAVRPHSANFMGAVWDRCGGDGKGDGAGAYMRGQVRFGNGTYSGWSEWKGDSSGCGNAGTTFSGGFTFPNRNVTGLRLQLCELDDGAAVECVTRLFT